MTGSERIELLAKELFGWKWMRYVGVPVKGTRGYPEKILVRQFMSPETIANWKTDDRFAEMVEADGKEPLSYCYCSSQGSGWPTFSDLDVRDKVLKEWSLTKVSEFAKNVWRLAGSHYHQRYPFVAMNEESVMLTMAAGYKPGDYGRAVIKTLRDD